MSGLSIPHELLHLKYFGNKSLSSSGIGVKSWTNEAWGSGRNMEVNPPQKLHTNCHISDVTCWWWSLRKKEWRWRSEGLSSRCAGIAFGVWKRFWNPGQSQPGGSWLEFGVGGSSARQPRLFSHLPFTFRLQLLQEFLLREIQESGKEEEELL